MILSSFIWVQYQRVTVDPSAALPPLFRLARSKFDWRTDQNSTGGGTELFQLRAAAEFGASS